MMGEAIGEMGLSPAAAGVDVLALDAEDMTHRYRRRRGCSQRGSRTALVGALLADRAVGSQGW